MAIEDENNYGLSGVQVKELVAQVKKRAVSVSEDGSSHVEEADQIYTKTLQLQEAAFVYRTTAGDLSIETGEANLLKLYGKTVQEGHVDEVKDLSYELAAEGATLTIDWDTFFSQFDSDITEATVTCTMVADGAISVWSCRWTTNKSGGSSSANPGFYGVSVVGGRFAKDDVVTIHWVKEVIGTLTTAKPTSFVSTGYNQYNATAGYAHVKGGQEYRIDDALHNQWNSLGFRTEPGGTHSTISLTNNRFTPLEDGYVDLNGVMADNVLIALVWSGTRDSDPYVAYSADTISIPTIDIDSASLPTASYGMPSVGNVADELNFEEQLYIQRIGHYAYSAENLETVEALGVDYWYDEEDIFYVLETPITYHLATSVKSAYTANDFGTEEIVGTSVAMPVMISYGNNLVDKLRNLLPIQGIGDKLEMNGTILNVAQSALDDVGGIKELTSADYNYPANNPASIALWLLEPGVYYSKSSVNISRNNLNNTNVSFVAVVGEFDNGRKNVLSIEQGFNRNAYIRQEVVEATSGGIVTSNMSTTLVSLSDLYANLYADPSDKMRVRITSSGTVSGSQATGIGYDVYATAEKATAYGSHTNAPYSFSTAVGSGATTKVAGEMNIGTGASYPTSGYNGTAYRILTGLHDGQENHHAATVAQGNKLMTAAPTTTDAGVLGQLWTDTVNMHTYQLTAIDDTDPNNPVYTWTQRW